MPDDDRPRMRQTCANSIARRERRTVTATFEEATRPGNLVILIVTCAGGPSTTISVPAGFILVRDRSVGYLQLAMYYYAGAPSMEAVTVSIGADRSLTVRAKEYLNTAQTNTLDKVSVLTGHGNSIDSGSWTGVTAQADEVVVAAVANRHASSTQAGFRGGLVRLFEQVTPQYFGRSGQNNDDERCRLTVHELIANAAGAWRLLGYLSTHRDWIAIIATFKGGTTGSKRMTSKLTTNVAKTGGGGILTAFGKFESTLWPPVLTTSGSGRVLPFDYQYRLNGLLCGDGTPYPVRSHEGLYGWTARTSDDDQPRGDGALRGVDLQSARDMIFEIEVAGTQEEVEQYLGVLYRTLTPQRDVDWELTWRHPTQAARTITVRPIELPRAVTDISTRLVVQKVALRAADPRHYSAVARRVVVPNTPAGAVTPVTVTALNSGDIPAYPRITITAPTSGPTLNRVQLVNETGLITFDVQLAIPNRSVLVGDMPARVTGAPRSSISLDGQSKYGAWQLPRAPFRLDPAPYAIDGLNTLYLITDPVGASVSCVLDYRDTNAG